MHLIWTRGDSKRTRSGAERKVSSILVAFHRIDLFSHQPAPLGAQSL